jgi:hypothetical protein
MAPPALRWPAVAGRFYPEKRESLTRQLDQYLGGEKQKVDGALGCVVPHAGYRYSGYVAGAVFARLPNRSTYIILGPNHSGRGAPLAIMSSGEWVTPLGRVAVNSAMADRLRRSCPSLVEDAEAHDDEHSLEVQLPFLQRSVGKFNFVPIAIGIGEYSALESLGHGISQAVGSSADHVMVVASSDMNHYEPDGITREKDRKAIGAMLALDPAALYDVLRREHITMCGFGPAIAMLTAAKDLGAQHAVLITYATSADASGDRHAVVGYAGIVVSK